MMPLLPWFTAAITTAVLLFGWWAPDPISLSAVWAERLDKLMHDMQLESIATRDADEPGRYVAAWHVRLAPILAVSGRTGHPRFVEDGISSGRFGDVYVHLIRESDVRGRWFIEDYGADGLTVTSDPSHGVDVAYESVETRIAFDGRPTEHDVSPQDYVDSMLRADQQYARMLRGLVAQLLKIQGDRSTTGRRRGNRRPSFSSGDAGTLLGQFGSFRPCHT